MKLMLALQVDSYLPIVAQHKDDKFSEEQKHWQQMRRGRYVEFNLVCNSATLDVSAQSGIKFSNLLKYMTTLLHSCCHGWQHSHHFLLTVSAFLVSEVYCVLSHAKQHVKEIGCM